MTSEPFEVTDDKGNTVTGTIDVFRDPKGPYFDPGSEYYMHPRYADARFDYFNTREACTIDRDALSRAMQDAFAKALTRFGIEDPGPAKIAKDVNASINATRQQCIQNADKYVSNETFSSSSWDTGEAVGNLTAKAYAAVPAPDGGIQTVVARENSWPAADVSALKNHDSANARVLSRRVVARDGVSGAANWSSSSEGVAFQNPTQEPPPLHVRELTGVFDSTKPMRYLTRRDGTPPPASVFDSGAPAAQFVLPDQLNTGGGRADWAAALAGLGPPKPMQAAPPPQAGGVPGTTSAMPVRILSRVSADKPRASVFDASAPVVPLAPPKESFSPNHRNAFASGSDAALLAAGAAASPSVPGPQGPPPSTLLEYIRRLNQLGANQPQASIVASEAPGASLAPSDSPTPMGGLAGRIAALAGLDPDNRDAPPPGGLLALLLAQQR
jgi:hypothetical protein